MWMLQCNGHSHGQDLKMSEYGRKLRPLVPRPICSCNKMMKSTFSTMPTTSCCYCIQNPNILSWNHPLIMSGVNNNDYGVKREMSMNMNMNMPLVSSRWNPTPEQLQALEEMYRRGTRTPSAEQIQQIASKLRRFGKIEGKNVFYWFQNHKARERQKKRRQLELLAAGKKKLCHVDQTLEEKSIGLSRRYFDIEHPKNLATPTKDSESMHGSEVLLAECKKAKNELKCWELGLSSNYLPPDKTVHTITAENGIKEINHTLQLFPIGSNNDLGNSIATHHMGEIHQIGGTKFMPNEFIEFLPTKN
ncbi:hypothetical protein ACJIZ3_019586 [Penstemon smallii]|uniref:Homeobox domain-containing protein n=1 Tax=Penstemon smallii TaxID=265156 RepID=A0ABD3T1K6_9LAMI